jgi:hypothetical protein
VLAGDQRGVFGHFPPAPESDGEPFLIESVANCGSCVTSHVRLPRTLVRGGDSISGIGLGEVRPGGINLTAQESHSNPGGETLRDRYRVRVWLRTGRPPRTTAPGPESSTMVVDLSGVRWFALAMTFVSFLVVGYAGWSGLLGITAMWTVFAIAVVETRTREATAQRARPFSTYPPPHDSRH